MRLVVEEAAIWWWATKFSVTSRERISTIHNLQSIQLPLGDKPLPYLSLTLSLSFTTDNFMHETIYQDGRSVLTNLLI